MSRKIALFALCLVLWAACALAWAQSTSGVKLIPYSIDYPLTRTSYYIPPKRGPLGTSGRDPYEFTFGVRRWFLWPIQDLQNPQSIEFRQTLDESKNWLDLYGSYGVLGHGEEVFTKEAASWRARHRGY
ncbi:MAG TPA: hypothetical protein VK463_05515 [Desulfomonilaceae bacterium]|nr:hypothetical protein [Desulfomonilaceae bacterium]